MSARSKARRAADAALAKVYAQVPTIDCKGRCQASCGLAPMTRFEHLAMGEPDMPDPFQVLTDPGDCPACPLLTPEGRCSLYGQRPLICRLWGVVDNPIMRCPWGCQPSRYLSDKEARALLAKALEISNRFQREEQ